MKIPSRILAAIALAVLAFAGPEISSAWGAYDNGLITVAAPILSFAIVMIGPVLVIATIFVAITLWILAVISSLGVLIMGDSLGLAKLAAKVALYVFSALIFVGVLLAITNFGGAFAKGVDAGHEPVWRLAIPVALALIAHLY